MPPRPARAEDATDFIPAILARVEAKLDAVARVEAKVDGLTDRVADLRTDMVGLGNKIEQLRQTTGQAAINDALHDERIKTLERRQGDHEKQVAERVASRKKVFWSVLISVVTAAVLAALGLG